MPATYRRSKPSLPALAPAALLVASLFGGLPAWAATAPSAAVPSSPAASAPQEDEPTNSVMDAPLFYQLLVGEMELSTGQAGVAYQVLLDAARRTQDEELFKRVVNIALQARAGEQALGAAKAWANAIPTSLAAHQMVVQLLALLNRPSEVADPLRELLQLTPAEQRPMVLAVLPRTFQRATEPLKVYQALEPVLQSSAKDPQTHDMALVAQARLAQAAGDTATALKLARELAESSPQLEDTMQLALDLMPSQPEAEALVTARLKAQPTNNALRLAYGRALARAQRPEDAAREFRAVIEAAPDTVSAWFALGAMELDLRHAAAAETALTEYLKRLADVPATDTDNGLMIAEARQQAWLMLSQAAEMRGDVKAAEAWLQKIDRPDRKIETLYRRASLLARQDKLDQGRKLLQPQAGDSDADARAKMLAEAQLLREARLWQAAHDVLKRANERFSEDVDLLYEQSMMAEKLNNVDEMETLLKRVIALKPDYANAYNALGYSLADRGVRLEESRGLIAKALSYAPKEPFFIDSMGWVEFKLGNRTEALRLLREAYQARPDTEIAAHLGEVLWIAGEQDEARRVWQEGAKREPKNEALLETLNRLKAKL
ncbi:tetratricopeptide repeat protein [Paucibacter sp. R3-3]|uniref:Tetratricopeptide repeat protein n=1 Tax=Roseateles agri TaxID=3098619 RepID=A0ABU5DQD8_9BURK|nr:tetratricopeptide repeat protein [Paucibacter sp. R3-3]MDY0747916.1 tetratricopeptide repeat protein [Paucibacter sp. R3-3]